MTRCNPNARSRMECKVCGGQDVAIASVTTVLGKYSASLLKCPSCGFEFFHEPSAWLAEAYTSPIADTDTGIVARSMSVRRVVSSFLALSNTPGRILDWGSGSGLLVRLLRDDGHDCYGYEPFTPPVLASGHTWKEIQLAKDQGKYRAITAIEVVEHLAEPSEFFASALDIADTLIFSTELAEENKEGGGWWYYSRETGQHISFYTQRSLSHLARASRCAYASAHGKGLHIVTRRASDLRLFKWIAGQRRALVAYPLSKILGKFAGRNSLTASDHAAARCTLKASQGGIYF
jgi:hypothetical protein